MADLGELSNIPTIPRNNDALTQALRSGLPIDVTDIARLDRVTPASQTAFSSTGTSSMMTYWTDDESAVTKPTSASTSHPRVSSASVGKGKQKTGYASSLDGTHGSASEAEAVRRFLCKNNLAAMGDWATAELQSTRLLRGSARAKERQYNRRRSKVKKPVPPAPQSSRTTDDDTERDKLMALTLPTYGGILDQSSLVPRERPHSEASLRMIEDGHLNPVQSKSLSRIRKCVITGLIAFMGCTVIVAGYATYLTGRSRMSCIRCIVFVATVVLASLTIVAMLIARRGMSEALLAGLLELVFGFALLAELNDFV